MWMKLYLSLLPGDNNDQLHQMNDIGSSEEVVGTREGGKLQVIQYLG